MVADVIGCGVEHLVLGGLLLAHEGQGGVQGGGGGESRGVADHTARGDVAVMRQRHVEVGRVA